MRYSLRFIPRRLVAAAVLVAGLVGTSAAPVAANGSQLLTVWTFILEFPAGNRNAATLMSIQGGQLAGAAVVSGKGCIFHVSGTFTANQSGGTFAMTWTGQKACSGEILTVAGDVVNQDITGTFTDTSGGGPFPLTGTVIFFDNN